MKQQLNIARALIHDPEILFLDEPTAGLDPETSGELLQYLRRFIAGRTRTVFLCSHRIAASRFAGEKERKTIQGLLFTPLSDQELVLGRIAVCFLPAMLIS